MLVGIVQRGLHLLGAGREDPVDERRVDGVQRHVHRGDLDLGEETLLHVTEGADRLLGEHERREHVLFGDLLGARLKHVDGVS